MSVTITPTSGSGPGNASRREVRAMAGRELVFYPFDVLFDTSYPTSGEDISSTLDHSPWKVLSTVRRITCMPVIAPGGTGGENAGDILEGIPDLTNKKLLVFTTPASPGNRVEVGSTHNLSLITIHCTAEGYA